MLLFVAFGGVFGYLKAGRVVTYAGQQVVGQTCGQGAWEGRGSWHSVSFQAYSMKSAFMHPYLYFVMVDFYDYNH